MNNILDIFVCTHKTLRMPVKNSNVYKLFGVGLNPELDKYPILRDNTGDNISKFNGFYCELCCHYWIWKNYKDNIKDWVGFNHYRRAFMFSEKIPDLKNADYDIIISNGHKFNKTVYEKYSQWHNIEDLDLCLEIIKDKFGISQELIDKYIMNNYTFNPFNIFIAKKEVFYEYCEFMFTMLTEFMHRRKFKTMKGIENYIKDNLEKYHIDSNLTEEKKQAAIKHQARIGGYLTERLIVLWLNWKNIKYIEEPVAFYINN